MWYEISRHSFYWSIIISIFYLDNRRSMINEIQYTWLGNFLSPKSSSLYDLFEVYGFMIS